MLENVFFMINRIISLTTLVLYRLILTQHLYIIPNLHLIRDSQPSFTKESFKSQKKKNVKV